MVFQPMEGYLFDYRNDENTSDPGVYMHVTDLWVALHPELREHDADGNLVDEAPRKEFDLGIGVPYTASREEKHAGFIQTMDNAGWHVYRDFDLSDPATDPGTVLLGARDPSADLAAPEDWTPDGWEELGEQPWAVLNNPWVDPGPGDGGQPDPPADPDEGPLP